MKATLYLILAVKKPKYGHDMDCLYCKKELDIKEEVMLKVTALGCTSCECIVLVLKDGGDLIKQEADLNEEV